MSKEYVYISYRIFEMYSVRLLTAKNLFGSLIIFVFLNLIIIGSNELYFSQFGKTQVKRLFNVLYYLILRLCSFP